MSQLPGRLPRLPPFPEGSLKEGSLSSKCPVMGWDGVSESALVETFCCPRGFAGPLPAPALGPPKLWGQLVRASTWLTDASVQK